MKVKIISEHIHKIEFWMWWKMSAWFVVCNNEVIMIDTGMRFMAGRMYEAAAKHGTVKAIFLTHGHSDHAGGADYLHQKFGLPILINPADITYTEGCEAFPGRNKCSKIVQPGTLRSYYEADREIELLRKMGVEIYHTPGHSPGHAVFYHKTDKILIAGDLFTSKNGFLMPPMKQFTADMNMALKNGIEIIQQLQSQKITLCHSDDVFLPYKKDKMKHLGGI